MVGRAAVDETGQAGRRSLSRGKRGECDDRAMADKEWWGSRLAPWIFAAVVAGLIATIVGLEILRALNPPQ